MRPANNCVSRVHCGTGEERPPSIVSALLVIVMLCTGVNSQEPSSTEYTFRSRTELILVNVTVRDKSGNPVRDLKREDFTLLEDNKPQQVLSFDLENTDAVLSTAPPKRHCFARLNRRRLTRHLRSQTGL